MKKDRRVWYEKSHIKGAYDVYNFSGGLSISTKMVHNGYEDYFTQDQAESMVIWLKTLNDISDLYGKVFVVTKRVCMSMRGKIFDEGDIVLCHGSETGSHHVEYFEIFDSSMSRKILTCGQIFNHLEMTEYRFGGLQFTKAGKTT